MGYNTLVKKLLILLFMTPLLGISAGKNKSDLYKTIFKDYLKTKIHKIDDPISEFKTNVKLLEVMRCFLPFH